MSKADAARPVSLADPNYTLGLIERVLLVPCEQCGAKSDERCIGQYGRRTKGYHWVRAQCAKEAGYLMGRYGQRNDLSRVRQLHHELLAVKDYLVR